MIRITVVDDDAFVLAGIKAMLAEQDDLEIASTALDGAQAIDLVRDTPIDVVLMDLRMPGVNGIQATRAIKQLPQAPRVLVLTTWDTDDMIRDALAGRRRRVPPQGCRPARSGLRDPSNAQRRGCAGTGRHAPTRGRLHSRRPRTPGIPRCAGAVE